MKKENPVKSKKASEERSHFRHIYGGEATVQRDFYAEFMRRMQESRGHIDDSYAETWAERFKRGDQFQFADSKHRQILLDVMAEGTLGDGTQGHLDKEDVKKFCERHSSHTKKKLKEMV